MSDDRAPLKVEPEPAARRPDMIIRTRRAEIQFEPKPGPRAT
jgi:hypothetical protein